MKSIAIAGILAVACLIGLYAVKAPESGSLGNFSESTEPCEVVSGAEICRHHKALATATTTVCAIRAPRTATSSLTHASVRLDVSSTSASTVHIAKAASAFATTTLIGSAHAVGANEKDFILASTSPAAADALVFAPGEYLVVGMAGGTGTFSPTGSCSATFVGS